MFLFHTICFGLVLIIMAFFVGYAIKNNCPKNLLFWIILLQGILICVQQMSYMIQYSIGGQ